MRIFRILVGGWLIGGALIVAMSGTALWSAPARTTVSTPSSAVAVAVAPSRPAPSVRGGILVPVQGVAPGQLHDTFTQARSQGRVHSAIDILAPRGTPVLAAVDGTVEKLFNSKAGGITVYEFDVSEERVYYYAHLERYADGLHEGQFLHQGEVIGYVGTTGNAPPTTPHLHFAIEVLTAEKRWWQGTPINPYPLLAR